MGQSMKQETADKFGSSNRHRLGFVTITTILIAERHLVVLNCLDPVIGKSDLVGIAAKIGKNLLRTGEGLFSVDDPLIRPRFLNIDGDIFGKSESGKLTFHPGEIAFLELFGQGSHMEKEVFLARNLMSSIQGKHACRDKAVDMKMIDECLTPGMKNRQQTRFPGKNLYPYGEKQHTERG
jgi:hypothetical protein